MIKNAATTIHVVMILRADGTNGTGLSPTARISKDGAAFAPTTNAPVETETGGYRIALEPEETDCDSLAILVTEATALTVNVQVYPKDPAAFQADVTNLDATVSSRMPTSHIAATGGKVNGVGLVDAVTAVTGAVETDTASREASKADVQGLATQAELDNVPKKGVQTWLHENGESADVTISQT